MTRTFNAWWGRVRTAAQSARNRSERRFDEEGFTLTELLIASTLLVVLLTIVGVTMSMIGSVSNNVSSQYQEYDQALPALGPIQTLLRAEIEPAPYAFPQTAYAYGQPLYSSSVTVPAGPPTPAYASIGNYSLTFYSNIGTAYNNVTSAGTTAGPAKIVAEVVGSTGSLVTAPGGCSVTSPCTFQVQEFLPLLNPTAADPTATAGTPTCPVAGQPASEAGQPCQYGTNYTLVTDASDVVNSATPVFTYSILDPVTGQSISIPSTATAPTNQSFTVPSWEVSGLAALSPPVTIGGSTTVNLTTCAVPSASYPTIALSCPADAIQSVGVYLQIAAKAAGSDVVNNQTIVYRYSLSAGETNTSYNYPYQYSSTTG
jgi:prepilin-type N-terminal cleavage/methylation domain-containing protein